MTNHLLRRHHFDAISDVYIPRESVLSRMFYSRLFGVTLGAQVELAGLFADIGVHLLGFGWSGGLEVNEHCGFSLMKTFGLMISLETPLFTWTGEIGWTRAVDGTC